MGRNFQIRALEPGDYAQWLGLWEGNNAFYERVGANALAPAVTETLWARLFFAREPIFGLAASCDGVLLGLTHYLFHRSTSATGDNCYLQDLFAQPSARGRGVRRGLIEAVYDRAREAGAGRVYWQTHETNLVARILYDELAQRSGFMVYRKML